ncbi:MAG: metalloregulator ArsR/SmtB family transcription factor [Acidobacteriota bacterium]
MLPAERTHAWVTFFKALADENRLKIVGLLAHKPHSVEEIAALLHISPATASHHLQRLLAADLVEARALQYYNVYALRPDALRQMAEQLLTVESIKETVQALDFDRYVDLVLKDYVVRGRLKDIPTQVRKRQVILVRLAEEFENGKRYPERRVNEILKSFHADYATLRRLMVEAGLLAQSNGYYWRVTT